MRDSRRLTSAPLACAAALLLPACVELPDKPLVEIEPLAGDAAVAFGFELDAAPRPPTAPPYMGPECETNHPMQPTPDEPILMDGSGQAAADAGSAPASEDGAAVAPTQAGDVIITELMPDPAALSDGMGEWIELHNPRGASLDLSGCQLIDGDQLRALPAGLVLQPDAHRVLARSDAPGLAPAALVAFTLNNGGDRVGLSCAGVEIDVVVYDGSFPFAAGVSLALSGDAYDAAANDDPAAWCRGQIAYADDLGSPGAPNPPCAADSDAGL